MIYLRFISYRQSITVLTCFYCFIKKHSCLSIKYAGFSSRSIMSLYMMRAGFFQVCDVSEDVKEQKQTQDFSKAK